MRKAMNHDPQNQRSMVLAPRRQENQQPRTPPATTIGRDPGLTVFFPFSLSGSRAVVATDNEASEAKHTPDTERPLPRSVGKTGSDRKPITANRRERRTAPRSPLKRRSGAKHGPTERLNRRGGTGPPPVPISARSWSEADEPRGQSSCHRPWRLATSPAGPPETSRVGRLRKNGSWRITVG